MTSKPLPGLPLFKTGKVRDVYDFGSELLIVASDRISAFDYILPTPIPNKGKILTQVSAFWFERTGHIVPNHMISIETADFPASAQPYAAELAGRSMLVKKTDLIEIECVVRGYLIGTGWKEYQATGEVCGIRLPKNLNLADKLPEPIFTPAIKARTGHDENVSFDVVADQIGTDLAAHLRSTSLALYEYARVYALSKGMIIADTKFEFGLLDGQLILIDEALTPDSSRFWPLETYLPGISPPSFDKQIVRDYLEANWDKNPPVPGLPEEIVAKTVREYERLQGLLG